MLNKFTAMSDSEPVKIADNDVSDEFKFDRFDRIMQLDAIEQGNRLALCVASGYETDGYFEYANIR